MCKQNKYLTQTYLPFFFSLSDKLIQSTSYIFKNCSPTSYCIDEASSHTKLVLNNNSCATFSYLSLEINSETIGDIIFSCNHGATRVSTEGKHVLFTTVRRTVGAPINFHML